jgi:glutamine phosphoribosylpyrophosphate amidotransferase
MRNVQPFMLETRNGPLALAHNGNLTNASSLRNELLDQGVGLTSSSDSEIMILMLARAPGNNWLDRIASCMARWQGAFSVVIPQPGRSLRSPRPMGTAPAHDRSAACWRARSGF